MSDAPESVEVVTEPAPNPFTLDEDHEFKTPEPIQTIIQSAVLVLPDGAEDILVSSVSAPTAPPTLPGTPESDYRRCPCIGVMPGRACPRCNCSKWVKTCPKCNGTQFLTVHSRKGAHARTERCGFCMGLGQVAARVEEVREAERVAKAYTAPVSQERPVYERGAQLPGTRRTTTFAERAAKKSVKRPMKKRAARG
jgi:hypothetical protein